MSTSLAWMRAAAGRPLLLCLGVAIAGAGGMRWYAAAPDDPETVVAAIGTLAPRLTSTGLLKAVRSITYRSPLGGREAEVTFLVPEGMRVNEGDLLVRLDVTELERELERAGQERRQAQVDLQVADIDLQEGKSAIDSLDRGDGALNLEEARTRLTLAERKAARLNEETGTLSGLVERGFITREEFRRTAEELERAEEEVALARRRSSVLIDQTHPRERSKAVLLLAQKEAQRQNSRTRLEEAEARERILREQIAGSAMHAERSGLVVYEEHAGASPRRKVRVGDRVTSSQGLVTISDVDRMLVETSVTEADVHRVKPGQPVTVSLEAFPGVRVGGTVIRIGALARGSADRFVDDKRFDLVVELAPADVPLRPEMTARVDILLDERRGAVLVPVSAVFTKDGVAVCHVVGTRGVETRQVHLGDSDDLLVEVLSGVGAGERVMVVEAPDAARRAPPPPGAAEGAGPPGKVASHAFSFR